MAHKIIHLWTRIHQPPCPRCGQAAATYDQSVLGDRSVEVVARCPLGHTWRMAWRRHTAPKPEEHTSAAALILGGNGSGDGGSAA